MKNIILIDNNDSFTFNLVQTFENCGVDVSVIPESDVFDYDINSFSAIVLSPGPGLPSDFYNMQRVISEYHNIKPFLGVCLGHQALSEYFGSKLFRLPLIRHGIRSDLQILNTHLYAGLTEPVSVGRYHSWAIETPAECLEITSITEDGIIMSFKHKQLPISGIQYHPESIITTQGTKIIENWLNSF